MSIVSDRATSVTMGLDAPRRQDRISAYQKAGWTVRRRVAQGRVHARLPSAGARVLPDCLVIGTMRGGTSSLYRYLGSHPLVEPSVRKEVEYFTLHHRRGIRWYRAHFPLSIAGRWKQRFGDWRPMTFEATPYYLVHPRAAERAAKLLPRAKIVVLLRDPVERALSHYRHMVRIGLETLGLQAALAREHRVIAEEERRLMADGDYISLAHHRYSYVARGRYAEQLERWLRHYPPDQILVVSSEEFYADTPSVYDRVVAFLGLPPHRPAVFANHSGGSGTRAAPLPGEEVVRKQLAATFSPWNQRLAKLGHDFGWQAA